MLRLFSFRLSKRDWSRTSPDLKPGLGSGCRLSSPPWYRRGRGGGAGQRARRLDLSHPEVPRTLSTRGRGKDPQGLPPGPGGAGRLQGPGRAAQGCSCWGCPAGGGGRRVG